MYVVGITGKRTILEAVRSAAKQFCKIDDGRLRCLYYCTPQSLHLCELLIC